MPTRSQSIQKSTLGGKGRRRAQAVTRYAISKVPTTSDSARAFITDFCMTSPSENKTIDLSLFDEFATIPNSSSLENNGYKHLVKLADNEIELSDV